ncbi:MAG: hypothetical protein VR65_07860 [Desulfobulbaceae bacterium BRH_c16a]|nr:MAG: hypothetical protein VR65_07860 [Desulfobulbaceae bacterium BRH_c16a]
MDKDRVASRFKASAATYEHTAIVQKEISRQLIAMLDRFTIAAGARVLEIGCCTGVLTELLCRRERIDRLFVNDIVPEFCAHTEKRTAPHVGRVEGIAGDIEMANLPQCLDLVISSSTFQWMTDLPTLLEKLAASLNTGGHLAFSIFGPGTMGEIASLTGRSLDYYSVDALHAMVREHFHLVTIHTEQKCLYFPSVRAVLRHIQKTGVGGLKGDRWTQGKLKDFEKQYIARFSTDDGLPVTYVSTFVIAEKREKKEMP